jgi:three prime repair exonuclease 1
LETTGLLGWGPMPKITELSIIAIPTDCFMNTGEDNDFRVKHKLSLCFNPMKMIHSEVTKITGLSNEMLEQENKFDASTIELIRKFLDHLQKPIVLIAHNGNGFDFKILKRYCERLQSHFDNQLMCCDSIQIFKKIYEETQIEEIKNLQENKLKNFDCDESSKVQSQISEEPLEDEFFDLVKAELQKMKRIKKIFRAEDVDSIFMTQEINETTPEQSPIDMTLGNIKKPKLSKDEISPTKNSQSQSNPTIKRELFPTSSNCVDTQNQSQSSQPSVQKVSMKLREVYHRFYSCYPEEAHEAEADVITLIKCAKACKVNFVKNLDEMSVKFCDVKST